MRRSTLPMVLAPALVVGCAAHHKVETLAELGHVHPDLQEVAVEQGLDQAMEGYRRFLEETPETEMTPEAMRRLADLQLEKQFGIRAGDGKPRAMAAPESAKAGKDGKHPTPNLGAETAGATPRESDKDFEQRTTAQGQIQAGSGADASGAGLLPGGADPSGPLEAIALYEKLLKDYR